MIYGSIATRYAKAIFELALEKNFLGKCMEEMEGILSIWKENEDFRNSMKNPTVSQKTRKRIMEGLSRGLALSDITRRFFLLLIEKNRMEFLELIVLIFRDMYNRQKGTIRGQIISAFPMEQKLLSRIKESLEKKLGKRIILEISIDETLIGGMIIKIGDLIIDGSLKHALKEAQQSIALRGFENDFDKT